MFQKRLLKDFEKTLKFCVVGFIYLQIMFAF